MKSKSWIIFAAIGSVFILWGAHQILIIPTFSMDHWEWLAPTPDLVEYIQFRFQNIGVFTLGNGLFILWVALTGFRNNERWAWWTLLSVPVYILLLTVVFYWLALFSIPITLLAGWVWWASRGEKGAMVDNRRGFGWVLVLIVGLLILYFAYDNFIVIPTLDERDPDRGWDWLTTFPAHIDYIKRYFRVYGIHVFAFGMMLLLTTWFGLRAGIPSSRNVLWLVPLLILVHVFFWPWAAPHLIAVAMLAGVGLWRTIKVAPG